MLSKYFWNLLIALDQLLNVLLGGDPDETVSSRCGKRVRAGQCYFCGPLCCLLDVLDAYHCTKTLEPDEGRGNLFKGGGIHLPRWLKYSLGVAIAALFCIWLSGCSDRREADFADDAYRLQGLMQYSENDPDVGEFEPLTAEKNWLGDCSNFAATLKRDHGARVWSGKLTPEYMAGIGQSGGNSWHSIACIDLVCADNIRRGVFEFSPDDWLVVWSSEDVSSGG